MVGVAVFAILPLAILPLAATRWNGRIESAVALSEKMELWLLAILALRDMRMFTEEKSQQLNCDRRIGALLRRMDSTPSELGSILNRSFTLEGKIQGKQPSFDAAAIMRL